MHLPTRVTYEPGATPAQGRVIVEPCESGYGTTLGNSFRRVLLSSLPGAAITDVKIDGVQHECSTVPHVKEVVVEIIWQLKQLRLKVFGDEPVRLHLKKKGEGAVTAAGR